MGAGRLAAVLLLCLALGPHEARSEESGAAEAAPQEIDTAEHDAGEDDDPRPRRRLVKWNEYEGPISTFRLGFGLLIDYSAYDQDPESAQQFSLNEEVGVRDSRLLFRGRFQTQRPLSWTLGYMYSGTNDEWWFRQTGIQIGFPEAGGALFIGRTKEGYSLIKVMTGYHPWTQERSPGLDAFVPILADGAKWMGFFPKPRIFFSLGAFGDWLSEDESFATYDHQFVTRVGWLPIASVEDKRVWHVAVMGRTGRPDEGSIRFRSRPEDGLGPYFVETPSMPADRASTTGFESYYRSGPWLFGGEYNRQSVDRTGGDDVKFHAGDVVAAWILTGETRAYNARGGYFAAVSPDRPVFQGGPGAWEAVLHAAYIDLDDRDIQGGKFWRLTAMVNWHLSDNVRFELVYGYGGLERFGLDGRTRFFHSRLQFTL
ncbi:MAG TPA: porin [Candidatus Polarisedimenticolaceae bacterium]